MFQTHTCWAHPKGPTVDWIGEVSAGTFVTLVVFAFFPKKVGRFTSVWGVLCAHSGVHVRLQLILVDPTCSSSRSDTRSDPLKDKFLLAQELSQFRGKTRRVVTSGNRTYLKRYS